MSESKVRTAIIGTGGIARAHLSAMAEESERVQVVAAVDIDDERVNAFARDHGIPNAYTDAAAMLAAEKPDLVHIATPPSTHAELSVLSPGSGRLGALRKAALRLAGRDGPHRGRRAAHGQLLQQRLSVAFRLRRPTPESVLIDSGDLGKPLVGNVLTTWYRTPDYYAVPWRGKWETELGGCSMGHGIHAMDFLLYPFGEWQEVRAMIGTLDRDIEVEDVSMAMVRFANGAMANITNSVLSPREESYLRLDFQKATVELTHLYRYHNEDWTFSVPAPLGLEDRAGDMAGVAAQMCIPPMARS